MDSLNGRTSYFDKKYANRTKEVYSYLDIIQSENEMYLHLICEIEYSNGQGERKSTSLDFHEILKAYELDNYEQLTSLWTKKYNGEEKAFEKIVKEMESKGLDAYVDEDESFSDANGFYMTNI